ncbi:ABC transporter ATP-binding protein [Cardiobacterium valvarum]|uniref:Putative heme ABC exporter, ATP-binding protein CcmA n=1 Tax=Cardiobacterium valvarum F0432 TaxID=797473 RepID=G9ZI40_9GAMM|nr:ABC transporter ATP-binding protein [Cardiobacterium valvarum]EHM52282.1 putative heme ABC exporter, ATP-binding protein CcmA [Cardiobacterium valvarum F0432]
MSALLTASQLSKTFGDFTAVNKVDIHINAGEMIALAGHNGAGKSTLMKMLLGLLTPTSGSISINGHSATSLAARQLIGYLPETVALYPNMTGFETLDFFADLKHVSRERNCELLTRVGIIEAAKKRVGTYSKGMRQRLALAQALLGQPKILLLDEPTTGLDPASRADFYRILNELRAQGTAILLSSHALAELADQADRIVIMKSGVKTADGDLHALRRDAGLPTHLRAWFADAVNLPAPWQPEGDGWVCASSEAEKVARLGELWQAGQPTNIDILPPALDDLYAHFLRREEATGNHDDAA